MQVLEVKIQIVLINLYNLCFYDNNGTVIKHFEEKQFEEVVIIAFEWFKKNKPELLNERKRRE